MNKENGKFNVEYKSRGKQNDVGNTLKSIDITNRSNDYDSENLQSLELEKDLCPTSQHSGEDLPCKCLHIQRLNAYLKEEVVGSWHLNKEIKLTELKLTNPATVLEGGQGVVFYMHRQYQHNMRFALKFKSMKDRDQSECSLEKREMNILREACHPFIVQMLHYFETRRGLFMALEYLDGGSLWKLIDDFGVLSEKIVLYYSACIIHALSYLHTKNIMYRDLKSENVVLDSCGVPRLIDFGLSKAMSDDGEQEIVTTYDFVSYLAPEMYSCPSSTDTKVDSWGIGYLMTELLLGYGILKDLPWDSGNHSQYLAPTWTFEMPPEDQESLSDECRNFITRMLARIPSSRPSMEEARQDPFFCNMPWSRLHDAKPPKDPHSGAEVEYPVRKATPAESERDSSQYQPNPLAPTIKLRLESARPEPWIDIQLARRFKAACGVLKDRAQQNIVLVTGNLGN